MREHISPSIRILVVDLFSIIIAINTKGDHLL